MIKIEKMDEFVKNKKYPPTPAQWQAISVVGSDVLVAAAAGSGKTEVLSERIARKVAKDRWDIDKVLVLTFTTAAAKNMLDRIEGKISERLLANNSEEDLEFLRKQRMLMNDANVSTIDSFCLNILRKFYYLVEEEISGEKRYLSPNFSILSNSKDLLNSSISEVLEEYYTTDRTSLDLLFTIFGRKEEIASSLSDMYYKLLTIPNFEDYLNSEFIKNNSELLTIFDFSNMDVVQSFGTISELTTRENIVGAKEFAHFMKNVIEENRDKKFLKEVLEKAVLSEDRKLKISKLFEDEKDSLFTAVQEVDIIDEQIEILNKELDKKSDIFDAENLNKVFFVLRDYYNIYYLADIINTFSKTYTKVLLDIHRQFIKKKRENNFLDFSDLNHLAIKALEDEKDGEKFPTVAAQYYKNHFLEIYVDEYQDNNNLQEYILNLIRGEGVNFFRVGDVKQAIYGFRGSNPDLFEEKYNSYEKLELDNYDIDKDYEFNSSKDGICVLLKENFRSEENVLNSSNYVFDRLMGNNRAGISYDKENALYYPAVIKKKRKNQQKEWLEKNKIGKNKKETLLLIENKANTTLMSGNVNYLSRELVAKSDFRNQSIENIAYEILKGVKQGNNYGDYAILVRNSTKMDAYKEVFKKYNIPLFFKEKIGFTSSQCFNILYNVFRFLDNTTKDTSLLVILHSELFDYSNDELLNLSLNEGKSLFEKLKNSSLKKDKETVNILNKWLNFSLNNSIGSLLEKVVSDVDFVNYLVTIDVGEEEVDYYENFVAVVAEYEALDNRLGNFVKYLKNIKNEEVFEAKKRVPNDSVTLSTIHISKGLEYKYVFVADLDTKFSKRGYTGEVLFTNEFGFSVDAELVAKKLNIESNSFDYFNKLYKINSLLIKMREREEEIRNLYVALTRAQKSLYLVSSEGVKLTNGEDISLNEAILESENFEKILNIVLSDYKKENEERAKFRPHRKEKPVEDEEVLEKQEVYISEFSLEEFYKNFSKKVTLKSDEVVDEKNKNKIFPAKTSYSALKKINGDYKKESSDKKKQYLQLSTLSKTTSTTKAIMRGNIVHKLFERIVNDIKKEVVIENTETYLKNLVKTNSLISDIKERRILTDEEFEIINNKDDLEKIDNFINSSVAILVRNSQLVQTEVAFTTAKKANELYKDSDSTTEVILQGVVDLLIDINDKEMAIIDYKTDNVILKNGEEVLKQRHEEQLRIYKQAVESYYNKKDIKTYIYSYKLSKLIEVETV